MSNDSKVSAFAASLLALETVNGFKLEGPNPLGSGTYGTVFRARHVASGVQVALKVFKQPLVKTDSSSLDNAWSSLAAEARSLEMLGAVAFSTAAAAAAAGLSCYSSSSSASSSNSLASPSGIPRLYEYGIIKTNSRSKGPGDGENEAEKKGGEEEEEEEEKEGEKISSVAATAATAAAANGENKENENSPKQQQQQEQEEDPSPDAVCYAYMATELLGKDLWHVLRETRQRGKEMAAVAAASSSTISSSGSSSSVSSSSPFVRAATRELLSQVAPAMLGALQEIHSRGLVHRDVKLDNFCTAFLDDDDDSDKKKNKNKNNANVNCSKKPSAYILDFGGVVSAPSLANDSPAVSAASKGKKTCFFGTPEYCASTAFTGEVPPTAAQDVEALGYCLLEFWLGGRLPWGEAFRARRETENERWSSSNLQLMGAARDADYSKAVSKGEVPWWLDAWITHAREQQKVFAAALDAAVARATRATTRGAAANAAAAVAAAAGNASAEGGDATAAANAASPSPSPSPPNLAPGEAPGTPNYRLLRSLLRAGAAQASAEAEVARAAEARGKIVGQSQAARAAARGIKRMEE